MLAAPAGPKLMEIIRDARLPIRAACGGGMACGTCHIHVDPAWLRRLPPPEAGEVRMIERTRTPAPNSRLACQIRMTDSLDGLRLALAPGSEPLVQSPATARPSASRQGLG